MCSSGIFSLFAQHVPSADYAAKQSSIMLPRGTVLPSISQIQLPRTLIRVIVSIPRLATHNREPKWKYMHKMVCTELPSAGFRHFTQSWIVWCFMRLMPGWLRLKIIHLCHRFSLKHNRAQGSWQTLLVAGDLFIFYVTSSPS